MAPPRKVLFLSALRALTTTPLAAPATSSYRSMRLLGVPTNSARDLAVAG